MSRKHVIILLLLVLVIWPGLATWLPGRLYG